MGTKDKKKKRHPVRNALLIILAIIIISAAVFVIANWKHVVRIYKGISYSEEEISSMQQENDKKTGELLNELAVETMRDLTDEERAMLASGELSKDDAIALIQGMLPPLGFGETTTESPAQTTFETSDTKVEIPAEITTDADKTEPVEITVSSEPEVTEPEETVETSKAAETTEPAETTGDETEALKNRISEIIAEIYLLRATYLNKIDALVEESKQTYLALPTSQRGLSAKLRIIENTVKPKGTVLENECDASMKVLLDELKGILKQLNLGTEIITEIEKTYQEQKDLKMAELYNKYAPK